MSETSESPVEHEETPVGVAAARAALAILPPVTLITGLLFYFGWVWTASVARNLSQDVAVYAYSTQDILLRSVSGVFFPLLVLSATALVAVLVHQQVKGAVQRGPTPWAAIAGWVVVALGVVLLLYGLRFALWPSDQPTDVEWVAAPLALGVGPLLIAYGAWLQAQAGHVSAPGRPSWTRLMAAGAMLGIVVLSLFWAMGNYAQISGRNAADYIADSYIDRPSVVVYSEKSLGLTSVVAPQSVVGPDQQYRYEYRCFRLLDHVAGVWYLLPEDWWSSQRLVMLNDGPSLRFELGPTGDDPTCPQGD